MEGAASEGVRGRGLTTQDDFLLVIIGLSWFLKTAVEGNRLVSRTPLNKPIAYYFLACVFIP